MAGDLILSEHAQRVRAYLHVREAANALDNALAELEKSGFEDRRSPLWSARGPTSKVYWNLDALTDYINMRIRGLEGSGGDGQQR